MKSVSSRMAFAMVTSSIFFMAAHARAADLTVILDPGHGGDDTGAMRVHNGRIVYEKELTLALARETKRALEARGIKVALTRNSDKFIALDKRTEIANHAAQKAKRAVFISIHANASAEDGNSGIETYVFNATNNEASRRLADLENGKRWNTNHPTLELILADLATTANYGDSVRLARTIQSNVVQGLADKHQKIRNRGIRQALFYVLMQTHMPGVLLEPGFLSNPQDLNRLLKPLYRQALARSLTKAIVNWRDSGTTPEKPKVSTMANKPMPNQSFSSSLAPQS